ncbi:MAG: EF-hand domain-containing protein [Verrucomicrobiota bacterium]
MKSLLLTLTSLALISTAPLASALTLSPAETAEMTANFAKADKNGDGKLTEAEAKAGMPRIARAFSKIDTQKTGTITLPEILAFVAAR